MNELEEARGSSTYAEKFTNFISFSADVMSIIGRFYHYLLRSTRSDRLGRYCPDINPGSPSGRPDSEAQVGKRFEGDLPPFVCQFQVRHICPV